MPIIDFAEGARSQERVPWQRALTALNVLLFALAQIVDTMALVGRHKQTHWSAWGLGKTEWGAVALLTSALWYVSTGVALKRSADLVRPEPEIRLRHLSPRARLVRDTRTKLPGIRAVALLTFPTAMAGFSRFPDTDDGRLSFNPGVFFTGWLLVILVLLLQRSGGAWPATLGVALWLPWAWYAQAAEEWPAVFVGILGLVLQITVFALVVRELDRQGG